MCCFPLFLLTVAYFKISCGKSTTKVLTGVWEIRNPLQDFKSNLMTLLETRVKHTLKFEERPKEVRVQKERKITYKLCYSHSNKECIQIRGPQYQTCPFYRKLSSFWFETKCPSFMPCQTRHESISYTWGKWRWRSSEHKEDSTER